MQQPLRTQSIVTLSHAPDNSLKRPPAAATLYRGGSASAGIAAILRRFWSFYLIPQKWHSATNDSKLPIMIPNDP
jgi:hypothetical protein